MKNIKLFCGKPLIHWTLKAIEDCKSITRVFVATDCDEIADVVTSFSFSKAEVYRRLPENATDEASTESVMIEVINKIGLADDEHILLVQATSPFTTATDLDIGFNTYRDYDSLLTCTRLKRFLWSDDGQPLNYRLTSRPRRQEFSGTLMENGAFYVNSVGNVKRDKCRLSGKVGVHVMSDFTALELDNEADWPVAEDIMRRHVLGKQRHDIRLVITDVDGVLTDNGMYYSASGDELKKFNTLDGAAVGMLLSAGIPVAIITGENTPIVTNRAKKLGIEHVILGSKNKLEDARSLCAKLRIDLSQVAFIGNDMGDMALLEACGLSAVPADAPRDVAARAHHVMRLRGGLGVFREFVEWVLDLSGT